MDEGFLEAEEKRRRRKKLVFLIGAVLISWAAVGGAIYGYWAKYGVSSEDRFDRELDADPTMKIALGPLRELFPYEYKRLRLGAAEDYNVDRHGRVIDHMPGEFLANFRKRHAYQATLGGRDEKVAFIAAQGALFDAAVADPKLCHMLAGEEDQMSDMSLVFSKPPFAKFFAAFVKVAASGINNKQADSSFSGNDLADLMRALRKIDPDPSKLNRNDEAGVCKQLQRNSQALMSLPQDQQARLATRTFQLWR